MKFSVILITAISLFILNTLISVLITVGYGVAALASIENAILQYAAQFIVSTIVFIVIASRFNGRPYLHGFLVVIASLIIDSFTGLMMYYFLNVTSSTLLLIMSYCLLLGAMYVGISLRGWYKSTVATSEND
ncbi:MAG: hypothetical protein ACPGR2_15985 [Psychrobium sp.]